MYAGLTTADKGALLDAQRNGMQWVARDWNDSLYGYIDKPQRNGDSRWFTDGAFYSGLSDSSLEFVQWNNDAPVNIDIALAQIAEMETAQTPAIAPLTWNERINQMTVEEKATWLYDMDVCRLSSISVEECNSYRHCTECMKNMLNSAAEVGK